MLPRRLQYWLIAALVAGASACGLNPQPDLPGGAKGEDGASGPSFGGSMATGGAPGVPGSSGSLNLGGGFPPSAGGTGTNEPGKGAGGEEPSGAAGASEGGETGAAGASEGGEAVSGAAGERP